MSLFKNRKLKTAVATVQGEDFTLTEPSALDMCLYWEFVEQEHGLVKDDSTNMFKAKINGTTGLMLVSYCLKSHFPDVEQEDIYKMLVDEITEYGDINIFIEKAEEVAGLKLETTDSQDGSSDTD